MFGISAGFEVVQTVAAGLTAKVETLGNSFSGTGKKAKEVLTPIQQLRKDALEAAKAFDFLNDSSEAKELTLSIGMYQDAASKLGELIKLRNELGYGVTGSTGLALPNDLAGITSQLEKLTKEKEGLAQANNYLKEFGNIIAGIGDESTNLEKVNNLLKDESRNKSIDATASAALRLKANLADAAIATRNFIKEKASLLAQGVAERFGLTEQIKLFGVTDELEKQKSKNVIDLQKYEFDLRNSEKQYSDTRIAELLKIKEAEQGRNLELLNTLLLQEKLRASHGEDATGLQGTVNRGEDASKAGADWFEKIKAKIAGFKSSLPSIKDALTENITNVLSGIGDIFAQSITN